MTKTITKTFKLVTAEHQKLCATIRRHDRLYYVDGAPEISDTQYDKLFQELFDWEEEHPECDTTNSPTQRVGGQPIDRLKPVIHGEYMLSIDNAFTSEALRTRWDRWTSALGTSMPGICMESKVDGCAVSLLYSDGVLTGAVTRGDGTQGDDILQAAKSMRGVPYHLECVGLTTILQGTFVEVRGEAYILDDEFKAVCAKMVKNGEKPYKHSRAAVVGALRSLDPADTWTRHVRFVMHGFGTVSERLITGCGDSWSDVKLRFRAAGMPVANTVQLGAFTFDEVVRRVDQARSMLIHSGIPMDGIVVKLDKFTDRDTVGASSRSVGWAIAVKKDLYAAKTTVKQFGIQVGKQGTLTPVCFMEPVEIDNTTVTKATLHNFDEVERLDIRVGDTILVEKAGKIIPHILEVDATLRPEGAKAFRRPTKCPQCGGGVVSEGVAIKCVNSVGCPAQLSATCIAAGARDRLDIDGLGPKLIEQLQEAKLIASFVDLWSLERDKVITAGVGEKTTDKLLEQLDAAKTRTPDKLLASLNIPQLGRTKSKLLVNTYGSIGKIAKAAQKDLQKLLGKVAGEAVHTWFANPVNLNLLTKFKTAGFNFGKAAKAGSVKAAEGPLAGKKVCATGTFEGYSRDTIHAAIEAAGGKPVSAVSSNTAYLVVGKNAGSKATSAKTLDIPCLTETEFNALISAMGDHEPV
jgi:DNA ligase (NAD+)